MLIDTGALQINPAFSNNRAFARIVSEIRNADLPHGADLNVLNVQMLIEQHKFVFVSHCCEIADLFRFQK